MSIRENATLHMAFNVDGPQTFMDYTVRIYIYTY